MAEAEAPRSNASTSQSTSRGASRGHRTRHRGRARAGTSHGRAPQEAADPGSAGVTSAPQNENSQPEASQRRGGRRTGGERGGRGQRQPRGVGGRAPMPTTQRTFGGQLTTDADDAASLAASLNAGAAEFVPGQPVVVKPAVKSSHPEKVPRRKAPKSTAADLGTRIHEDISTVNYECAICTDDVVRASRVWSCTLCWTVVHLKCARRWYDNQRKQDNANAASLPQNGDPNRERAWRCPGCNSRLIDEPSAYSCWCGKDVNPRPASASLPPHSCGQSCLKPRATCPHPCGLQCHAGPCPPCLLVGPEQFCFCAKASRQKLCRETDYETGWGCGDICGDLLPCGEHTCTRPCHSGVCGDCDILVDSKCFCGRVDKTMPCYEREDPQQSYNATDETWFEGTFECDTTCERPFDCGKHQCQEPCHPQDEAPAHCPFSPNVITHCPCGKTPLGECLRQPRVSCEDAIPHCEKPCEKPLACGHLCPSTCHRGECVKFCRETIQVSCRCGRTTSESACHQGIEIDHPLCRRICQANLGCGRHKCGEHCCPGEKKAIERVAARRKHRVVSADAPIEAEHICVQTCGRMLKCGLHECQALCHRGACPTCPDAIFDDVSCACGRTVLPPPQPCGTRPPECRFSCRRRPGCGHPPVEHNCHADEVACPKCPFLVEKMCVCGKERLKSQPCHLQEPHCGKVCGKKLGCGLHFCKKLCHREGQCQDEGSASDHCDQTCGKAKLFCGHSCERRCHGMTVCNESMPCQSKATITCPCGQHKQDVRCLTSASNPAPTRPDLKCNDECLRLERNRRLAAALNIDPDAHASDHIPYSDTTLRLFRDVPGGIAWAETQEREFRVFSAAPDELRMRYKPMPSPQRQFLHVLAQDYGLKSHSEDADPHRYVLVYKGPHFVSAPGKTLAQCVKLRDVQAAAAAAAAAEAAREKKERELEARPPSPGLVTPQEPFNALLLISPRFGLTIAEVTDALRPVFASQPLSHEVEFLPSDEILVRATASYSAFLTPAALENSLQGLRPRVVDAVTKKSDMAGGVLLCHAEADGATSGGVITRREVPGADGRDGSGWSAVAGRAANKATGEEAPSAAPSGRRVLGLRRKGVKEVARAKSWASQLNGDAEC